jgi:DNA mismatch repair protein MutL
MALACPSIHFTLRHGERLVHDAPATGDWRERIEAFFGAELTGDLIWIESDDEAAALRGYVANPAHSRSNNRMQYLFLNGRFIRDRSLQHALGEAYRGLLLTGRFPIALLRLELRPDAVDVNVHPTKLEVRFEDAGRIYSQLLGTLRTRFLTADLTARVTSPASPAAGSGAESEGGGQSACDPDALQRHRAQLAGWARGDPPSEPPFHLSAPASADQRQSRLAFQPQPAWRPLSEFRPFPGPSTSIPAQRADPARAVPDDSGTCQPGGAGSGAGPWVPGAAGHGHDEYEASNAAPRGDQSLVAAGQAPRAATPTSSPHARPRGLQVQDRYLVTDTEDGLVVIDQHALHERILYEQIRERV